MVVDRLFGSTEQPVEMSHLGILPVAGFHRSFVAKSATQDDNTSR